MMESQRYVQFLQTTFSPLVLVFTVSNLAAMGLQVKVPEVVVALRNKKSLALIFVWGWVLGPAFGYLITRVLPLAEPYVVVVLLASLAPCAPFLQQMVEKPAETWASREPSYRWWRSARWC